MPEPTSRPEGTSPRRSSPRRISPRRISKDDVAKVAHLARLRLDDDELETTTAQLAAILDHAADVEALDLDGVEPTSHPVPMRNVFRSDEPAPTLDRDEVLAQAPATEADGFSVPAILGEEP